MPELSDANSREDSARTPSGFGSPKKLNMQTKIRNKQGVGINLTTNNASLHELDKNSPMTPSKAFAVRNFKNEDRIGSGNNQGFTATMSPNNLGRF